MNNLTGNNSSEMLHLLLDGELAQVQEVPLFSALAANENLRGEMKDLISIRNTVHRDDEAFVPPFAATAAVFQSTGFSLPMAGTALSAGTAGGGFYGFLKSVWIPILVAGMSSLITYYIVSGNYNDQIASMKSVSQKSTVSNNSQSNAGFGENLINNQAPAPKVIIKYVKVPTITSSESTVSKAEALPTVEPVDEKISSTSIHYQNISPIRSNSMLSTPFRPTSSSYEPMYATLNIHPKEYMFIVRGLTGVTMPSVNASTPAGSGLTNISLGFYFLSPYSNIHIGVEGGQEPFSQNFVNTEGSRKFRYEQRPNVVFGGVGAIGKLNSKIDFLYDAQPFGQLFIGGSELGPLGKMMAGLTWGSDSWGLNAFLALEGSFLAYQNQSIWYSSQKMGITYGFSVQF
jgi:hypothetical protein